MPPGHGQFGPQGLDWQDLCRTSPNMATYLILIARIYVGDFKLLLLNTKYISCGQHGFRKKNILFSIISPWELMTHVRCQFGPQGHGWLDLCRRPPNIATYLIC